MLGFVEHTICIPMTSIVYLHSQYPFVSPTPPPHIYIYVYKYHTPVSPTFILTTSSLCVTHTLIHPTAAGVLVHGVQAVTQVLERRQRLLLRVLVLAHMQEEADGMKKDVGGYARALKVIAQVMVVLVLHR